MTTQSQQNHKGEMARRSIARLRELVRSDSLSTMARVDPHNGEVIDPEARALFSSLPAISPATTPDELVTYGLLPGIAEGLTEVHRRPRYRAGREVFVRTSVNYTAASANRPVGAFDPDGPEGFTHRAVLRSADGDAFYVELEGASELLRFSRDDIFSWNEPRGLGGAGGTLSGVHFDYNEPRLKAYICAGYLEFGADIAAVDFRGEAEQVRQRQLQLITRLAERVDMHYAGRGEGYRGPRGAALIDGGQGVCFVQRAVAAAYLQPFARVLAFELQPGVGRTLEQGVAHGFLVLTLLPSLQRFVSDPAWSEPLTDLRVAFFGPRWGHNRMLEQFEGDISLAVPDSHIDLPEARP